MGIDIPIAFVIDILLGDPKWLPHTVRIIGKIIQWGEKILRWILPAERLAGMVLTFLVVSGVTIITAGLIFMAHLYSGWLAVIISIYLCYTAFSACSLGREAHRVRQDLERGDLTAARKDVGNLVGRDTENLSESEVIRATVETVAENTVDGSLSPILYAWIGGAPLVWLFKASSTLDSMVGYYREPYYRFGWASAKLDDLLNWIPARLAHVLIPLGVYLSGLNGWNAFRISLRDGQKHPSPNAGISESAFAGALQIQLGGPATYGGVKSEKPYLGNHIQPPCTRHITEAVRIMWMTSFITLLSGMALSYLLFKKVSWLTYPMGIPF